MTSIMSNGVAFFLIFIATTLLARFILLPLVENMEDRWLKKRRRR